LDSTELSGTLPWELGKLSGALEYLLLSYSRISGTIPDVLGDLTKLVRLDVHSNQFTGSIPLSLGRLSKLTYFSLGKNYLTGPFPSVLQSLTKVELFSMADNSLKGSIPTFVRNYRNLKKFFIQGNRFSRSVEGLFDVQHQLQLNHVDMSDNLLTGHLPEELFKLVAIDTIALSGNCIFFSHIIIF
jgi:Leucine-rich repeat (LRR) protein